MKWSNRGEDIDDDTALEVVRITCGWLKVVIKHDVIKYKEKRRKETLSPMDDKQVQRQVEENGRIDSEQSVAIYEGEEYGSLLRPLIKTALSSMQKKKNNEYSRIVQMKILEGKKNKEIQGALNIKTPKAAKQKIHRAISKFREELKRTTKSSLESDKRTEVEQNILRMFLEWIAKTEKK